ncbi:MAG: protein-tyrosine phosphatase family protein [Syntrophales bacterium]
MPEAYRYDINFDPAMLALVDRHPGTGNILVRGNMPVFTLVDGKRDGAHVEFDKRQLTYDELNSALNGKIPGFDLSEHRLIDISMIDDAHAGRDTFIPEVKSFGLTVCDFNDGYENRACWPPKPDCSPAWEWGKLWGSGKVETQPEPKPDGQFVWWPTSACDRQPGDDINNTECANISLDRLLYREGWNFSGLVDFLYEQMKVRAEGDKRKVLYIHCSWGKDRTGSLAAAYLLKKAKEEKDAQLTLNKAIQAGKDAVNVVPNDGYLRLTVAYCKELFPESPERCRYTAP